ncbi:hypothetical protein BC830DRAFT_1164979 [Chytriomyces sp. MP71]|nr:hypothetical protein BC830DRAFT_1164979 [Chytriomyces sp. MP71]
MSTPTRHNWIVRSSSDGSSHSSLINHCRRHISATNAVEDASFAWEDSISDLPEAQQVDEEGIIGGSHRYSYASSTYECDAFESIQEEGASSTQLESLLGPLNAVRVAKEENYGRMLAALARKRNVPDLEVHATADTSPGHDPLASLLLSRLKRAEKRLERKAQADWETLEKKEKIGHTIPSRLINVIRFKNTLMDMDKSKVNLAEMDPEAMKRERERMHHLQVTSYLNRKLELLQWRDDEIHVQRMHVTDRGQMVLSSDYISMIAHIGKGDARRDDARADVWERLVTGRPRWIENDILHPILPENR